MQKVFDCAIDTDLLTGMRLAKVALERTELAVIPTDTVYGLAANAFSPVAVQALLDAKGRGRQSPPPVLVSGLNQARALVESIPDAAVKLAETFWPGALTMIFKAQPSIDWDLGETKGTVALRVPDHKIALALIEETGPLAVSSANLTGQPAATTCQQAFDYLKDSVAVYLDAGTSPKGEASTIIDMTNLVDSYDKDGNLSTSGTVKIVRRGALSEAKIRSVIGDLLEAKAE
ncbi:MAG: threonylcarbamoyl-AMP synthase [Micrococcales bacterium]|nr:threonylcarbamoyl-AMP synthase [Micrococcales bacterium]